MTSEFRIILTAIFATAEERDKMYAVLKDQMLTVVKDSGIAKRADMTRDDYFVQTPATEQVI